MGAVRSGQLGFDVEMQDAQKAEAVKWWWFPVLLMWQDVAGPLGQYVKLLQFCKTRCHAFIPRQQVARHSCADDPSMQPRMRADTKDTNTGPGNTGTAGNAQRCQATMFFSSGAHRVELPSSPKDAAQWLVGSAVSRGNVLLQRFKHTTQRRREIERTRCRAEHDALHSPEAEGGTDSISCTAACRSGFNFLGATGMAKTAAGAERTRSGKAPSHQIPLSVSEPELIDAVLGSL
jgi:hypothetical protein